MTKNYLITGKLMHNFKKNIFIIAAVLISSLSNSVPIINLKSFFTANEIKASVNGEFLTAVTLKGKGEVNSGGIDTKLPVRNSYISVSSDSFDLTAVEKGFFPMEGNSNNRLKLYRSLTDFYSLKGMSYYSQTAGADSILIIDSYRIKSSDDYIKENLNDKTIPESALSHFAIKDNRLGLLTFRSEFISKGENFIVTNISTGTASKYGMKIFYPGDYKIYKILIYDKKLKGYFFYTVQFMKVRSSILSRIDLIKPESFGNRVRAENVHFLKSIGIDRSAKLAAFK